MTGAVFTTVGMVVGLFNYFGYQTRINHSRTGCCRYSVNISGTMTWLSKFGCLQHHCNGRDGLNIAQVCPNMLQLLLLLQYRASRNVYIDHLPTHPRFSHLFGSKLLLGSHMTASSCLERRNTLQKDAEMAVNKVSALKKKVKKWLAGILGWRK